MTRKTKRELERAVARIEIVGDRIDPEELDRYLNGEGPPPAGFLPRLAEAVHGDGYREGEE